MDFDDIGGAVDDVGESAGSIDLETAVDVGGEVVETILEGACSDDGESSVPRKPRPVLRSTNSRTIIWSIVFAAGVGGTGYLYGSSQADDRAREMVRNRTTALQDHYYPVLAGGWLIAKEQLRPLGFNIVDLNPSAIASNERAFLLDPQIRFPAFQSVTDAADAYARLNAAYTQYQGIVNQCERLLSTLDSSNQEGTIYDVRKTAEVARRNAETVGTLMEQLKTRLDAARLIQPVARRRGR